MAARNGLFMSDSRLSPYESVRYARQIGAGVLSEEGRGKLKEATAMGTHVGSTGDGAEFGYGRVPAG